MAYEISIQNTTKTRRSYCIVAHPPKVSDINAGDLFIPLYFKTDESKHNGESSITFDYDCFAFVGKLKQENNVQKIEVKGSVDVKLGTAHGGGDIARQYFDGSSIGIEKAEPEPDDPPREKGSFMIKCSKSVPAGMEGQFVVGLAYRRPGGTGWVDPVAAMKYIPNKNYIITPSGKMCICAHTGTMSVRHVIDMKQKKFVAVGFPNADKQVTVTEDDYEKFWTGYPRQELQKFLLSELFLGQGQSQSAHKAQFPQPSKAQVPEYTEPWKAEADNLGFGSIRQLKAYQFLKNYNKKHLAGFHEDEILKNIAKKANDWGDEVSKNDNLNSDYMDDLLVLALFDCILFLDNSKSIDFSKDRSEQRREISASIVEVERIYDNTKSVRVAFLNGIMRDTVSTADELRKVVNEVQNFGLTPLGTELEKKILKPYVYDKLKAQGTFRPLLISIITDGNPQGEPPNTFKTKIKECAEKLNSLDEKKVGDKHVLFQISRVGNDRGAIEFIKGLKEDPNLKKILHYLDMDIDTDAEDEAIAVYAPAIKRLAGAAFVGLKRDKNTWEYVFNN